MRATSRCVSRVLAVTLVPALAAAQPPALGGYLQLDGRLFVDETEPSQVDQFVLRRARLDVQGTLRDHYDFRVLPDFGEGKLVLQEAYVDLHYRDDIEVRFGKSKVPFGLERLQRDIATTFVERGLPSLLVPNRDVGVQVFGVLARGTLEYELAIVDGIADNASADVDTSDHKVFVARAFVTHGPLGAGGGATWGIAHGTLAAPQLGTWTTQAQSTFFAYRTGTSTATTALADGLHWRATAHASWYLGRLGLLAEWVRSQQEVALGDRHGTVAAQAWQLLGQLVVSGGRTTFQGVVPTDPHEGAFVGAVRLGAIQLLDRSAFDHGFADPTTSAHHAVSAGAGLDWLPDRSLRFVLDLEHTWFEGGARHGDRRAETAFVARVQAVF